MEKQLTAGINLNVVYVLHEHMLYAQLIPGPHRGMIVKSLTMCSLHVTVPVPIHRLVHDAEVFIRLLSKQKTQPALQRLGFFVYFPLPLDSEITLAAGLYSFVVDIV